MLGTGSEEDDLAMGSGELLDELLMETKSEGAFAFTAGMTGWSDGGGRLTGDACLKGKFC